MLTEGWLATKESMMAGGGGEGGMGWGRGRNRGREVQAGVVLVVMVHTVFTSLWRAFLFSDWLQ